MDAFRKVDDANLKPVYKADGQSDWQSFRQQNKKGTKTSLYGKQRHTPSFPKLGVGSTKRDLTNFAVGNHDEVLAPSEVSVKPGKPKKPKVEEEQETKITENPTDEDDITPKGWNKLTEPGSNRVYFFDPATGNTKYEDELRKELSVAFIPAEKFQEPKEGFEFKSGPQGMGYYRTGKESISESVTTQKPKAKTTTKAKPTQAQPLGKPKPNPMQQVRNAIQKTRSHVPAPVTWVPLHNPTNGCVAYYNKANKAMVFSMPPELRNSSHEASQVVAKTARWQVTTDQKTGKAYYFNHLTRETCWVNPEAV